MSVNKSVHKLNVELQKMNKAEKAERAAEASEKKLGTTEKNTLSQISGQEQAIFDQFQSGTLTTAQQQKALTQLFGLGEKEQKAVDAYKTNLAKDKASVAKDKKAVSADHKAALKDLKPAELHLSLKQTNADRKELGLKGLKKAIREPSGKGADAIKAGRSVLGQNIQSLKYHGPLAKYLDKWPSDHVCCANFVSAALEKAGLIKPSEHSDAVSGLASNLSRDHKWQKVSSAHMKPGDVVCFEVPGEGHMAHVEMFAGYKNGVAEFIGSNNVNSDGSQRISEGHVGYHIDAVYHYKG
jgi:hypothetical protein